MQIKSLHTLFHKYIYMYIYLDKYIVIQYIYMQGQDNIQLGTVLNVFLRVFAHSHSMKRRHSTRRVSFACDGGNCWRWLWSGWCCWCCRIWSGMCQVVVAAATPTSNWCRVHWGHCRQATHLGGAFGCLRFAKERDTIECGCAAVCCRYQSTVSMWRVWRVARWRHKCVCRLCIKKWHKLSPFSVRIRREA